MHKKTDFLSLNSDILNIILNKIKDYPPNNSIKYINNLSQSSREMHTFLSTPFKKKAAKYLTSLILTPINHSIEIIKHAAKTNPSLFFIKTDEDLTDFASDLEGNQRMIKGWSPYQAIFGTGDAAILFLIRPTLVEYLSTIPYGFELAAEQVTEKFPDGFQYKASTYDFNYLVKSFEDDIHIDTHGPNADTLEQLKKFRNDFKPGIVENGYHFNINHLINALQFYNKYSYGWNLNIIEPFCLFVIGFLQRLITAPYLALISKGLKCKFLSYSYFDYPFNNEYPHILKINRQFKVKLPRVTPQKIPKIDILPLNNHPEYNLGVNYFINTRNGEAIKEDVQQNIPLHKNGGERLDELRQQSINYLTKLNITKKNAFLRIENEEEAEKEREIERYIRKKHM